MPHSLLLLISYMEHLSAHAKLMLATAFAGVTFIAEITNDDMTTKAALLGALGIVWACWLKERAESKRELKELMAAHRSEFTERDKAMLTALNEQTEAIQAQNKLIEDQSKVLAEHNGWNKQVVNRLIEEKFGPNKPTNIP